MLITVKNTTIRIASSIQVVTYGIGSAHEAARTRPSTYKTTMDYLQVHSQNTASDLQRRTRQREISTSQEGLTPDFTNETRRLGASAGLVIMLGCELLRSDCIMSHVHARPRTKHPHRFQYALGDSRRLSRRLSRRPSLLRYLPFSRHLCRLLLQYGLS